MNDRCYPFLGYQETGRGKAWLIGFNFFSYAQLSADPVLTGATQDLTILLYSSAVGDEIRAQVKQAGGDAFLGKTMNHSELVTHVRNWLLARPKPGGVGEPTLVKVARDIGAMLNEERRAKKGKR